ncbi:hypothetical protein ACH4FX_36480 [Streptomyces sp. NPDC018019]|uniref:hypothetical protein n=1 Tax=Streptomyces sp. NPDC018019 TaxID=3365030 RepID=UPI0037A58599
MSPDSEEAARKEAARIEPVLKRLWKDHAWDPDRVRTALVRLGYRTGDGLQPGTLIVSGMGEQHILTQTAPVAPEGALFALRVRKDACVHGAVKPLRQSTGGQRPVPGDRFACCAHARRLPEGETEATGRGGHSVSDATSGPARRDPWP